MVSASKVVELYKMVAGVFLTNRSYPKKLLLDLISKYTSTPCLVPVWLVERVLKWKAM